MYSTKQLTMRQFCTLFLAFGLSFSVFAQNNFWKPLKPESIDLPAGMERTIQPLQIQTFQLDYTALKTALLQAPMEFTPEAWQPLMLSLPLADGSVRTFRVWESPLMAPELAAKYPEIRNYAGEDAEGLGLTVRLGVGYKGFHAFIYGQDSRIQSVRPYAEGTNDIYMTYRQEDLPADPSLPGGRFKCGVDGSTEVPLNPSPAPQTGNATDRGATPVTLHKYRLAVAAQGEYSVFHGGTKPLVLSAIVEAMDYITAIQERDWAVRLELIPNNDEIIFLDPATDPYSGDLVTSWFFQNPAAINPIIGSGSYDIGHVFTRVTNIPGGVYVAGIAELASVCLQNAITNKARAGSSLPNPIGEGFYGIIAHEMGHQFSANHTFNICVPADEVNTSTAFEPGGGSTIMSYATTCDPDVVDSRDNYFHVASIEEVTNFIAQGAGSTCGEHIVTDNNAPEVNIPLTNGFYIPIGTPFMLAVDATDADGDALTYCWEQYDLGPSGPLGQPTGTAPSFRSFPAADDPSRTFPRLTSIVFNQMNVTEVLPTYSREFNFKCTVRDNHPGVGGVSVAAIKFNATAQAGPFAVTYPNSGSDTWKIGEYQTITWDVANTNKAPVNCKTVNIWLSLNNGLVNQILLASGVPNTGKCCVLVPNNVSDIARVRIEAADNIFFDISNTGFKIQPSTQPGFSICPADFSTQACAPTTFTTEISTVSSAGFSEPITFAATGLPAGAMATFSPNPVAPGSASTLTIDFSDAVDEGLFDLTLEATADSNIQTSTLTFNVVQNDFSALALQLPADGAQSVDIAPWLHWSAAADADFHEIQVASSPSFDAGTILASKSDLVVDSFKIPVLLTEGQVCYWRVRPRNECGNGDWTEPFVFVTKVQNCAQLSATDLPINISSNGTPTIESKINVPGSGALISDVNVKKVSGNHNFMFDLEVNLLSPAGTQVLLFKNKCSGYAGSFNIGFDDSANGSFSCPPPQNGSVAKPTQLLSAFNGENAGGEWKLRVKDNNIGSGGQINGFELEFCSSIALNAPFLVNNNTLQVAPGTNAVIGENLLKVEDSNNSAGQLVFTLITVPKYGDLRITGTPLQPGSQFTQDDINNGLLRYYEYGVSTGGDNFKFSATDGEGGLVNGTFNIQPFPLSAKEPQGTLAFDLAPNPASESLRLFVSQAFDSDSRVRLFNTAGQMLHSWTLPSGATMLLLDVADLPEGVYAVSVENENSRGVRKVVVQ